MPGCDESSSSLKELPVPPAVAVSQELTQGPASRVFSGCSVSHPAKGLLRTLSAMWKLPTSAAQGLESDSGPRNSNSHIKAED